MSDPSLLQPAQPYQKPWPKLIFQHPTRCQPWRYLKYILFSIFRNRQKSPHQSISTDPSYAVPPYPGSSQNCVALWQDNQPENNQTSALVEANKLPRQARPNRRGWEGWPPDKAASAPHLD